MKLGCASSEYIALADIADHDALVNLEGVIYNSSFPIKGMWLKSFDFTGSDGEYIAYTLRDRPSFHDQRFEDTNMLQSRSALHPLLLCLRIGSLLLPKIDCSLL